MTIKRVSAKRVLVEAGVDHPEFCELSFSQWNTLLDCVEQSSSTSSDRHAELAWNLLAPLQNTNIIEKIKEGVESLKNVFTKIAKEVGASLNDIILAFRSKDMFMLLKAVKFNFLKLYNAAKAFAALYKSGLAKIFKMMEDEGWFDKLRSGAASVDELLNKYPLLRKLAGPAIAGILLYIWWHMAFIGHPDYDLDCSTIISALMGSYNIHDLFTSPDGLQMLSLLAVGQIPGVGVSYWVATETLFLISLCYTGLKHIKADAHIRDLMFEFRSKLSIKKFGSL